MAETHIIKGKADGLMIYLTVVTQPEELEQAYNKALCIVMPNSLIAEYWFGKYFPDGEFKVYQEAWL